MLKYVNMTTEDLISYADSYHKSTFGFSPLQFTARTLAGKLINEQRARQGAQHVIDSVDDYNISQQIQMMKVPASAPIERVV